jgi:hypothetical protein
MPRIPGDRRLFQLPDNEGRVTREVEDEIAFHLEERTRRLVARGMDPAAARAEASREFGDVGATRADLEAIGYRRVRHRRRAGWWSDLRQDVRYGARALRRAPGFTLVAALTLALGIGANTAIFSVVNGVLLRPLPYADADRLVRLFTAFRGSGEERYAMSEPEFVDYKGLARVFENAAAYTGAGLTLTGDREPERVRGIAATADLFPVLGIAPDRGRGFEAEDGRVGREPVVVVTHAFWQNRYGGDPALLGRTLRLNGTGRRVVGILPPGQTFNQAELFIPLHIRPDSLGGRGNNYLSGVARLRPDVSVARAQQALNELTTRSRALHPRAYRRAWATPPRSSVCTRSSWATCGPPSSCSSARWGSCCSSRARTWRTCSSRAARHGSGRWPCGSPSVPDARGWCGSCSRRASCWPSSARWAGCCSRGGG